MDRQKFENFEQQAVDYVRSGHPTWMAVEWVKNEIPLTAAKKIVRKTRQAAREMKQDQD